MTKERGGIGLIHETPCCAVLRRDHLHLRFRQHNHFRTKDDGLDLAYYHGHIDLDSAPQKSSRHSSLPVRGKEDYKTAERLGEWEDTESNQLLQGKAESGEAFLGEAG